MASGMFIRNILYLLYDIEFSLGLLEPKVNLLGGTIGWKKCKKRNSQNFLP